MNHAHKIDMTKGRILPLVFLFALPICAGNVLQILYGTVDTLVIGNFCGQTSLAAVGTSAQPVEVLLCIFLGIGTGISILVSQAAGKSDTGQVRALTAAAVSFLYLSAIPVTILGCLLGPLMLKAMQAPESTLGPASAYLRIVFLGTLGNIGYNLNAGILRGLGDSRSPLLFLVISCLVNIALDLLFVGGFGMDVQGAALATSISMYASWIFSMVYIRRKYPELQLTFLPGRPDRDLLVRILKVGLPLGLNNSIYSIGHILLQSLVNTQGAAFMAACSVAGRVSSIANVTINSFSSSATTFAGQNYGAGEYRRLVRGSRIPFASGLVTFLGGITVTIFCYPLLRLFTKDEEVLALAARYIRIVLPMTWPFSVFSGIVSYANGMGDVRMPTLVNILMLWVIRIPSAWLIATFIDGQYLMACYPISFTAAMVIMLFYFRTPRWRQIRELAAQESARTSSGSPE